MDQNQAQNTSLDSVATYKSKITTIKIQDQNWPQSREFDQKTLKMSKILNKVKNKLKGHVWTQVWPKHLKNHQNFKSKNMIRVQN